MKTIVQTIMIASILALLTGCNRIPAISAKSIHYESTYPIGGSTIDITGVEVTDTEVKAATYKRKSRWWYVSQDVQIEGYSRKRTPADVSAPAASLPVK